MKKLFLAIFVGIVAFSCSKRINNSEAIKKGEAISIYSKDFIIKTLSGEHFNLKSLKGKKVMIVNTASKCGLTPQYEKLEALYQQYKDKNFVIIGFPANNFLSQEPGTNEEIGEFCKKNYGVSFPMMSKISVKGNDMHPIYQFLTQKNKNGVADNKLVWNFQKYLIDENGYIRHILPPTVEPDDKAVLDWLQE